MPSSEPDWRRLQDSMRELDRDPASSTSSGDAGFAGRYELQEVVGEGAVGKVWRAHDRKLDRIVAVKELNSKPDSAARSRERFEREARLSAMLSHPNLIPVYDAGEVGGKLRLVMEYVEGPSLYDAMAGGQLDRDALVRLLQRASRGVAAAHEKGILHRDLKPANILVTPAGEPKVGDFGLARFLDRDVELTQEGTVLGTPLYMAPEQVGRDTLTLTLAADVYALGAILYEMLTGNPPHQGTSMTEIFMKISVEDIVPPRRLNPAIPVDLETITMKAVERHPENRYANAGEFAEDLGRYLAGESIHAKPPTPAQLAGRWIRRRAVLLGTVGVVVALASTAIVVTVRRSAGQRDRQALAVSLLEQARPVFEKTRRSLYRRGTGYTDVLRQIGPAHRLVERAIELAPGLAPAHFMLGCSWEFQGQEEKAEASWMEAVRIDPDLSPAHMALGHYYLVRAYLDSLAANDGERESRRPGATRFATRAVSEFRQALRIDAGIDHELDRVVGDAMLAYMTEGPGRTAEIALEGLKTFNEAEGGEELHWLFAITLQDPADQLDVLDHALRVRPNFPIAVFGRGAALAHLQRYEESIRVLTEAIELHPRFSEAYLNRGSSKLMIKDMKGAIEDLRKAVEYRPDNSVAHGNLAASLQLSGRSEEALAEATRAIEIEPSLDTFWFIRGDARYDLGKFEEALADYDQGLKLRPDWPKLVYHRGRVLVELKRWDDATRDLEKAIELIRPFPDVLLLLARARSGAGDAAGARRHAGEALKLARPDWPGRAEAEKLAKKVEDF